MTNHETPNDERRPKINARRYHPNPFRAPKERNTEQPPLVEADNTCGHIQQRAGGSNKASAPLCVDSMRRR